MRWKINHYLMSRFHCQFDCRNHIAVGRYNNREVAVILICIGYNLCSNTYIGFFFFVGMDFVTALETGYLFLKIFPKYQFEFGIFFISLKKCALTQALVYIIYPCRKIFNCNKLLIGTHEHLKQLDYVKPIILLPPDILFKPVIEIETVYVYDYTLFVHKK